MIEIYYLLVPTFITKFICLYIIEFYEVVREKVTVAQSCLTVTPWTVAHQAPLSKEFSRQEYWSGQPFPSPGDLPHPVIEPGSPACRQILYHLSHQG